MTLFATAQIDKTFIGLTFFNTDFLMTNQTNSPLFPNRNEGLERLIINHQFNFQYHVFLTPQVEISAGIGMNLQYYSAKSQRKLQTFADFLEIDRPLFETEDNDEVVRIRFNNIYATLPICFKYFFKKDPMDGAQPAFSVQFLTERSLNNRVNARYITDRDLFVHRSSFSSIDPEIERFYEEVVTKVNHSLRIGLSFQNGGEGDAVRHSSFDVHFVYYFKSFDSGITEAARGISCAWRWQF